MAMDARWPRRTVLGLAGGTVAARWLTTGTRAQGVPTIAIDEPTRVDLGVVALGTDPEVRFAVRNEGDAPLTLEPGRLAAGLRLEHLDSPIAPRARGEVRVRVETFRAGPSADYTIPLRTNDPQRDTVILQVHADVRTYVLITPPTARFAYVQHEREGGTTHLVAAAGHADFRVTRVESPYPFIDVAFRPAPADTPRPEGVEGPLWHVQLTIRRQAEVGPLTGSLVIETNHPRQPRAWIPLSGFVRPLFAVTPPSSAGLQVPAAGDAPIASYTIAHFGEAPVTLRDVTSSVPGLAGEVTTVTDGHRWRLDVRATAALASGPFEGTITVRTSRPEASSLTIAVAGRRVAP